MKFKCIKKCWFGERLWVEGEILEHEDEGAVPQHFEKAASAGGKPVKTVAPKAAAKTEKGIDKARSGKPTALADTL